jgi:ATP-dependent DNA helicase RecQ
LSAVYKTGQRFGLFYVVDVLLGHEDERIVRFGHDKLSVFGVGRDMSGDDWKALMRQMVAAGLLTTDAEGRGTLQFTDAALPVLRGQQKFMLRRAQLSGKAAKPPRRMASEAPRAALTSKDQALFDALRALRQDLAAKGGVPPYVIFHDRTLIEIALKRPASTAHLHTVTGLGDRKIARYGEAIVAMVKELAKT